MYPIFILDRWCIFSLDLSHQGKVWIWTASLHVFLSQNALTNATICNTREALYGCNKQHPNAPFLLHKSALTGQGKQELDLFNKQRHPTLLSQLEQVCRRVHVCLLDHLKHMELGGANKNNPKATGPLVRLGDHQGPGPDKPAQTAGAQQIAAPLISQWIRTAANCYQPHTVNIKQERSHYAKAGRLTSG